MSRKDKLEKKLLRKPSDFAWNEAVTLLGHYGYNERKKGKTGGSRRAFYNEKIKQFIRLHKPHPSNNLKKYQMKQIINELGL